MKVELIDPNTVKVSGRQRQDLGDIEELANSIKELGQIHPIVVGKDGELIAGHRRLLACKSRGVKVASVRWENLDPDRKRMVELEENIRRKNLTPAEEVMAKKSLLEVYQRVYGKASRGKSGGFGQKELAKILGVPRGTLQGDLDIANLIEQFPKLSKLETKQEILKEGKRLAKLAPHSKVDEIEVVARVAVWLAKQNWQLKAFSPSKGAQIFPSEDERRKHLISTLEEEGCEHDKCEFSSGGPGIISERGEVFFKVECKGLGEGKASTLRNNFDRALASAVSYYDRLEGIHLGLGFPDVPEYKNSISARLPDALRKKLNIWVFLLSEDRLNVKAFPPEEKPGFVKPKPSKEEKKEEKAIKILVKALGVTEAEAKRRMSFLGGGGNV